jgi:ribosomal protein S12 methylthiotransferase accessory factor YcaO
MSTKETHTDAQEVPVFFVELMQDQMAGATSGDGCKHHAAEAP